MYIPIHQIKYEVNLLICIITGMLVGSYFWGCLADTKGRKLVLMTSLILDGVVGILSTFVQYYWLFTIMRVINGFA